MLLTVTLHLYGSKVSDALEDKSVQGVRVRVRVRVRVTLSLTLTILYRKNPPLEDNF